MGDAENDRAIRDSGNYYVYNTASGTLTYVDSLGGSTSYNTGAQDTPKRIEDVPPANVDTAQDERYTWNPEYPPIDDSNHQLTPEDIAMIERAKHDAVIIHDYDPNRDAGILH